MNGVHDMGGMDGFGPVRPERNEPVFHESWERRVFGMFIATLGQGLYNLDEVRHAMERIPPAEYIEGSYYEHWLGALERLVVEKGLTTSEELERLREAAAAGEEPPVRSNPELVAALEGGIAAGGPTARGPGRGRFLAGDRVRVRRSNPKGHTRSPRYVRGIPGTIERVYETFVFPDTSAHGGGECPEVVYSVRFEGADVWGDTAEPREAIYVDLWESYLEPLAEGGAKAKTSRKAKAPAARTPAAKRPRAARAKARPGPKRAAAKKSSSKSRSKPAAAARRGRPARRKRS